MFKNNKLLLHDGRDGLSIKLVYILMEVIYIRVGEVVVLIIDQK